MSRDWYTTGNPCPYSDPHWLPVDDEPAPPRKPKPDARPVVTRYKEIENGHRQKD